MAKIVAVSDKKLLKAFIDFPHELYKNDPYYVPELFIAQRDMLTPGKHPFYDHSRIQLFLAYNDEQKPVGRIAAIINGNHNNTKNVKEGFFGFFDSIDDKEVSQALLSAAQNWLKENGQTKIMGPVNFSTNDICGLLIEGYDGPPVAMMPYNAPYYLDLLEDFGFEKKVDLRAYRYTAGHYNDRAVQLLDGLENRLQRSDIIIRKINLKKFKEEAAALREVYNKAWDKNLGFVPMTDKEFDYTANDLKLVLDTDFCYIAEQKGKIVGFALAIPDINQILIKIKRGRLFPTGLLKLLLGKKKINGIRILLLGVIDGYRKLGIEACLYGRIIKAFKARDFKYAEASWTLEDNEMVNRPIENIGGKLYRKYRILEKAI
jgi:GNAT superfamily N-acetyltransferase